MLKQIQAELAPTNTRLVAVSKTKPNEKIEALHAQGQMDFGENRVSELVEKYETLPKDINWHFIGHLQTNKVKYIAPFVHFIHSVDSPRILKEINKQAARNERVISCLLQFKIAAEDSKYGLDWNSAKDLLESEAFSNFQNIQVVGVMGMATFTDDMTQVRGEFKRLKGFFEQLKTDYFSENEAFKEISMGMSGDYQIAIEEGSTMVRIGSLLFGARNY